MPPKKLRHDWSWVGEVDSAKEITDHHRLAAAGLTDVVPCTFAFPTFNGGSTPVKEKTCRKKSCETNPGCYNHMDIDGLLDPKGKGNYVEAKLSRRVDSREKGLPAGLRNLGATCYANAFLQLWFHNVAFRNAIYACAPIPGSPLFHLAHIFASLQYTEKKFVDPMSLIESLRLNTGEQQDAAEFSKLFLEMITNELLKQKDLKLRGLTKSLFEGTVQYTTTCDCGFASQRDSSFLELELSLKEGTSLIDRLDYSLTDERLEGDNKYHCQACGVKRNAIRSATIKNLPPILHFSLLRFVFDAKTYERRKSRASISFPRHMQLGGHSYHLQAIITHSGPSAHEGHFVCEAREQATGTWFMCNDEDVSIINRARTVHDDRAGATSGSGFEHNGGSEPPPKRSKVDENTLKSKDAYMLVYTRLDPVDPIEPPVEIMQKVDSELAEWYDEQGRQEVQKYVWEEEYQALVGAKTQVARLLPGIDCLVPSAELERWFGADRVNDLFKPWTIPVCPHGDVDPDSIGLFKLVSLEAFDQLQDYRSDVPVDNTAKAPTSTKKRKHEVIDLSQSRPPIAESAHTTNAAVGDASTSTDGYTNPTVSTVIPRYTHVPESESDVVYEKDPAIRTTAIPLTPSLPGFTLKEHPRSRTVSINATASSSKSRQSSADMSRTPSSQAGVRIFSKLPRMTICPACIEAEYRSSSAPGPSEEDRDFWKAEIKLDRQILKLMDPKFVIYDIAYYYLPDNFVEPWLEFVKYDYAPRPILRKGLDRCEHGLLSVDLEMNDIHFIEQKGWDQIVQKYGDVDPVTFRYPKVTLPDKTDKRSAKTNISVGTCESCRRERLSDFEETQVYLKLERTSIPTSRRSKNKEVSYDVKKTTSVVDIKVEIMHQTGITPINIVLYHNGRELLNEETVGSIGILTGDQIVGKEMEVIEIKDEPVVVERGFGGTALHGRLACPECTFENQSEAACCEMCTRPFGFD